MSGSAARIGIDLGGTKIEGAVLDGLGDVVRRERTPTPKKDYPGTLNAIGALIEQLEQGSSEPATIGVATPGAISPSSGLLKNANSTCLNGRPVAIDLEQRLGRPVRIANDADCFALSEATDGAAAGCGSVFGVILGTGVGGGIVVGGKLVAGPNAIAGEWGHNPLPRLAEDEYPGPHCYCGRRGCIESFLSGPALTADFEARTGETVDGEAIVQRAAAGDPIAEGTLARYDERLARALSSVINIVDPEVIVLGGGLSNLSRLYENVPRLWGGSVFSDTVRTRLVPPLHGDSSGVRGAAWLWA